MFLRRGTHFCHYTSSTASRYITIENLQTSSAASSLEMAHSEKAVIALVLGLMLTAHFTTGTDEVGPAPANANNTAPAIANNTAPTIANNTAPAIANNTAPAIANNTAPAIANNTAPAKANNTATAPAKCLNFCNCTAVVGGQQVYGGTVHKTVSGRECQRWDSQTPHSHTFGIQDSHFRLTNGVAPEKLKGVANYCRDTDNSKFIWCYTKDPAKRWERCAIPSC